MLRASAVEITLTESDLHQALTALAPSGADGLKIRLRDGAAVVVHTLSTGLLPVSISVELEITVRSVASTHMEADVVWINMPILPGFVKELALKRAFEPLPGEYKDGRLRLDLMTVLEHVPVSFRLTSISIRPDGVRVGLADLVAFPVEPAGLVVASSALVPVPSAEEAELPEHQPYYQKLRAMVAQFTRERAPAWVQPLLPWVLAVPDFFVLMVRLARDERVPTRAKLMAGAAVAYFLSWIDLIPDPIPILGQVDDIALAIFVLEQIRSQVPEHVIEEAWPGEGSVLDLVDEGVRIFHQVLPDRLIRNLKRVLGRSAPAGRE